MGKPGNVGEKNPLSRRKKKKEIKKWFSPEVELGRKKKEQRRKGKTGSTKTSLLTGGAGPCKSAKIRAETKRETSRALREKSENHREHTEKSPKKKETAQKPKGTGRMWKSFHRPPAGARPEGHGKDPTSQNKYVV